MEQHGYAVVIEHADGNYSAYSPDIDGVVTTGDTVEETFANFGEALALHLSVMRDEGLEIPAPSTVVRYLDLAA